MNEIWLYRSLLGLLIPLIVWGVKRWIKSNDNLAEAVNGIKEYISSQNQKNEYYDMAIKRNDAGHRGFYNRIGQNEKDIVKIKSKINIE